MKVLSSALLTLILSLAVANVYAAAGGNGKGNAYGYGHCSAPGLGHQKNKHPGDGGDCSNSGGGGSCSVSLDLASEERDRFGNLFHAQYTGSVCDLSSVEVDLLVEDLAYNLALTEGRFFGCSIDSQQSNGDIVVDCFAVE